MELTFERLCGVAGLFEHVAGWLDEPADVVRFSASCTWVRNRLQSVQFRRMRFRVLNSDELAWVCAHGQRVCRVMPVYDPGPYPAGDAAIAALESSNAPLWRRALMAHMCRNVRALVPLLRIFLSVSSSNLSRESRVWLGLTMPGPGVPDNVFQSIHNLIDDTVIQYEIWNDGTITSFFGELFSCGSENQFRVHVWVKLGRYAWQTQNEPLTAYAYLEIVDRENDTELETTQVELEDPPNNYVANAQELFAEMENSGYLNSTASRNIQDDLFNESANYLNKLVFRWSSFMSRDGDGYDDSYVGAYYASSDDEDNDVDDAKTSAVPTVPSFEKELEFASRRGYADTVRRLLATPEEVVVHGMLTEACKRGHAGVVEAFLQSGRRQCVANDPYLLDVACARNHVEVVRVLLAHGADPSLHDAAGLRAACWLGHADIVRLILDSDPDLTVRWRDDEALRGAARGNHTAVVRMLLRRDAWFAARQHEALKQAERRGHSEVVALLRAEQARVMAADVSSDSDVF